MKSRVGLVSVAAVLVLLFSGAVFAADNLISGKVTVVKANKLAKFVSKSTTGFPLPNPLGAEDPTINGAQLRMFDTVLNGGAGDFLHSLPAAGWTGLGNPAGSSGYKYKGSDAGDTICKIVLIKAKVIKATCKSPSIPLDPAFAGPEGILLGVPATTASAIRYCAEFGGTEKKNDTNTMKRKDAPAPPMCPFVQPTPTSTQTRTVTNTPTSTATRTSTNTATATGTATATRTSTNTGTATATRTATNTATNTATATATRTSTNTLTPSSTPTQTPTPNPHHNCVLNTTGGATGASHIGLFTEALGAPINFGISGSLDIAATGSSSTCDIINLNPVNIIGIGFVCISPGPPCPPATRWCGPGPGPALGIDSQSDGNTGACTSNADCATICAGPTHCNGAANVLTSGCTGFCTLGTQPTCNLDADCLPSNGACNGPDPVMPNQNICQCSCINNAAHGPSDPGDLQCNLASNLIVEMAAPCNGTDILINVGDTCIPVSTQRATGLVTNSNFNACGVPPCLVPVPPNVNDQSGNPVACATMDSSTVTGFVGVGAVNFFGSTLGDLSVGLKATCN